MVRSCICVAPTVYQTPRKVLRVSLSSHNRTCPDISINTPILPIMKLRPTEVNNLPKVIEDTICGTKIEPTGLSLLSLGSSYSGSVVLESSPSLTFEHICRVSNSGPKSPCSRRAGQDPRATKHRSLDTRRPCLPTCHPPLVTNRGRTAGKIEFTPFGP